MIARVAPAIVRAGCVHNASTLRWIEVDDEVTDSERRLFGQPIALATLGRMLVRIHRDALTTWRTRRGRVDTKPVVITIRHSRSTDDAEIVADGDGVIISGDGATYITVLGLPVVAAEGAEPSTRFIRAFGEAARASDAQYFIDAFDSSTMLIDSRNLKRFLSQLTEGVEETV